MRSIFSTIILLIFTQAAFSQQAIYVEINGIGKPIIYLPGFTSPGSVWYETSQNIIGEHQNHFVSYAGFNGLKPIGTPWYQPLKNELIAYIEDNNLKNVTILGHSMGGSLGIDVAAELPERISTLILVETIPDMRAIMMPNVPPSSLSYDSPYNSQMINMGDEEFKQMSVRSLQNMTFDLSKIEMLTNWMLESDRETYAYGYTDLLKMDLTDKLFAISARTLVLGADFPDKAAVLENYERQYDNLKSKTILIADDSKHYIMFDQPQWLYHNINSFLDGSLD